MYEVLDASINLTLNDQDAIRGVERLRATVKRNMRQIAREKAIVKIEGNLKPLKKDLKEAESALKAQQKLVDDLEAKRKRTSGAAQNAVKKKLATEKETLKALQMQTQTKRDQVQYDERNLRSLRERVKLTRIEAKEARQHAAAERDLGRAIQANEKALARKTREQEKALAAAKSEGLEVVKLQKAYDKQYQTLQKIRQEHGSLRGRFRRAADPTITQRVEIQEREALEEMARLRAELEAMGAKPIEIETTVGRSKGIGGLAGIGSIGTRIGPFAGELRQFAKAALALGPILVGLVGYVGALSGAVGAGLTGALAVGGAAATAFGLSLGGVGLLTVSLFRDFKKLNQMQDAYHTALLKFGKDGEKTQARLEEFNHALGAVTPTTRKAFLGLDALQDRWRGLRKDVKPDFMNALGEALTTINADFGIFSRKTEVAFKAVSAGFQEWMRGLRTPQARRAIGELMDNANKAIPPLLHGLGQLGAAWGRVAVSFSRFLKPLMTDFDHWATNLDKAASNTDKLDRGTGRLYRSFRQTLDVLTAFSRVIIEFTRTAMGPGGRAMVDLADGLNGIADGIAADRVGENKLGKFLSDSVETTKRLYNVLQPLLELFIEFTTVMRPVTDILLTVAGGFAKLAASISKLDAAQPILLALGSWWMFRRTPAALVTTTGQLLSLAGALLKVGKAGRVAAAGEALSGLGGRIAASRAAGAGGAGAGASVAGGAAAGAGGGLIAGGLRKLGGAGVGAMVAGQMRGGLAGALTKSVVGGLGGTLLSGILRAGIWGTIGVGIFKGIKTGLDKGIHAGAQEALHSITFGLTPKAKDYTEIDKKITDDIDRIERLAQQRAQAKRLGLKFDIDFKTEKFSQGMQNVLDSIERMRAGTVTSIGEARSTLQQNFALMTRSINVHSARGKSVVADAYRSMAASIKRGMRNGQIDTEKGTAEIQRLLMRALAALGVKGRANQLGYLATQDYRASHPGSTGTGAGGAATGYIGRPGARGMDMIPLMVGRGEAVLNSNQQRWVNAGLQAIGVDGLPDLFQRESTPHYMNRGGYTNAATGYSNPRGGTPRSAGPREADLGQAAISGPRSLPRYITRQEGMWGLAVQGGLDTYHKAATAKLRNARKQAGGFMGMGKGMVGKVGAALARALGLTVTSTTGGKHVSGSWHYKGRAIDVAGSPGQMMQFFTAAAGKWGKNILELFYDPAGWYIKNGQRIGGAIGGHSDHVHLAMARGGFAGAARGKSPLSSLLSSVLGRAPGLQGFNRQFKKGSREQLDPMVIRAIGEAVGMSPTEALHAMQISKGESTRMPGAVSKDGGFGLMQNTPRVWGPAAKKYLAQLGGESALMNPIISMAMAKYLMDDRKKQGKDPLGPWFGTKYLRRGTRAKGSVLPSFQTKGAKATEPRRHGATLDLANLLALDEANVGRAGRTSGLGDDIWAAGVLGGRLTQQNRASTRRIGGIDKRLKGRLTASDRSSLLSERAGLIGSIESNRQKKSELRKDARDKLFEYKRGKGKRLVDVEYKKALADSTEMLDDDLTAAQGEQEYWQARVDFLKQNHATLADITEAQSSLNSATANVKSVQDDIKQQQETVMSNLISAKDTQASLTDGLDDDLSAAQFAEGYYKEQYDLATAANDNEGIAKWGSQLKGARDNIKSISESIAMMPLQTNQVMASLTTDLNDDVSAAQALVDYYQGIYNVATGADKITAGQSLSGARSDLTSARRNAELLPLERNQALAALTETLDDDKSAMVALRDYWKSQLDAAQSSGDIPGQIEAAQNLKGLNDEIKGAEQSVAAQMVLLSEARRDLYKAFSSNLISQVPTGTLAPGGSTTYNGGTTVNVTNNFQEQPADPHTWSAGVAWELQAAV
jgi:hypothetical protein